MTTTETTTTTNPDEYNGWTNRETWATYLHLSNDYDLYTIARRLVTEADTACHEWYNDHDADMPAIEQTSAAADTLAEWVDDMVNACLYNGETHGDLIPNMIKDVGSLWRVDWRDVAQAFRDE